MKQKDLALILIIVFISAVASFFISKAIFASPEKTQQEAEVVQAITSKFPQPDKRFFNDQAFDPTKPITIGPGENPAPFRDSSQ